ncbi:MAG: 2Fe-2S iron-sulfur cluster-binding protein [Clostridiales bacterium]|nr:2Fe-2S iron-sulfur cluster-binding protein [Clostridiales bacterium]
MNIIIDGKACTAEPGQSVMEAARLNGIDIPALCHHEALPGQACCRLCVVEAEDAGGGRSVVASCTYPAREGISIYTKTEKILAIRKTILAFLNERAPDAEGALQAYLQEYCVAGHGLRFNEAKDEKCILCGLCSKACEDMEIFAIQTTMRGIDKIVAPPFREPPEPCVGCAACVRVCPTGAVECTEEDGRRTIWGKTFELVKCASCGEPFATAEEMEWLKGRLLDTDLNLEYCPRCRGKVSAGALA